MLVNRETFESVVLVVTLDPGSSLTKIIYQIIIDGSSSELKILSMEPELMKVTRRRIEDYEAQRWTSTDPAYEAWVESSGEYYAVGFLAKQFCGNAGWNELKYERAGIKLLAAIGVIAFQEGLPDRFDLALTVLLPYKEYKDAHKFESEVSEALTNFSFRNRWHSVNLWMFDCKPEGAGLALTKGKKLGIAIREKVVLVIMLGFRDVSFLRFERGKIVDGGTSEQHYGLILLAQLFKARTSDQSIENLVKAVHLATTRCKTAKDRQKVFAQLVRSKREKNRAQEIVEITDAYNASVSEYWSILSTNWLDIIVPPQLDLSVIGGGSSVSLKPELKSYFGETAISWSAELEEDVRLAFNLSNEDAICDRYADAYGVSRPFAKRVKGSVEFAQKV